MKKKNNIMLVITIIVFFVLIAIATYSYFSIGTLDVVNAVNVSLISENTNLVFDTTGGVMNLTMTPESLQRSNAGNVAAQNSATLTVSFTPNTSYNMVCSYNIVYEWVSTNKYTAHTSGASGNEFTIQATLASNAHVSQGTNSISSETDLSVAVGNNTSKIVVTGARIDGSGSTTSSAVWTITTKFYNVSADQNAMAGKTYEGRFKVANVSCHEGHLTPTLAEYLVNDAPKSGTDAVSSSPWVLTSDHQGEWRYAGKNPDNYVTFNSELWRIIGVFPNMTYCTGTFTDSTCSATATGTLVKIVRNSYDGSSTAWNSPLSNNWYGATLNNTLQAKAYASNANVAVVNWSLYGVQSGYNDPTAGGAAVFYNKERNIGGLGGVYTGNPTFWYGKVAFPYPSDYGYGTNGSASGTYNRAECLNSSAYNWNNEPYLTDCAKNDWLLYTNITSTAPSSGRSTWLLTPGSERNDYVFYIKSNGSLTRANSTTANYVRPALYLKATTLFGGSGTGKHNDPYTISS